MHIPAIGREDASSININNNADVTFPAIIFLGEIDVRESISIVCCSFSIVSDPAVRLGVISAMSIA